MSPSRNSTTQLGIFLHEESGRPVCRLRGELDTSSAPRLRAFLAEQVGADRDLVIDLAGLEFIDSSGLGVLVGALKRAGADGHQVILRSPTPALLRVLEMTGLAQAFPLE